MSTLIVERLAWETGGSCSQVQLPLHLASKFFGKHGRDIWVNVFMPKQALKPAYVKTIAISKVYKNGTRRINNFSELGAIGPALLFFQQTASIHTFDFWWQSHDMHVVAANYDKWYQATASQHGRGRIGLIVDKDLRNTP